MSQQKRVVITGMGVVTPIGNNVAEFWQSLMDGTSGIAPITHFDTTNFDVKQAAEVKNLDYDQHFDRKEVRRLDNFVRYAMIAAREAFKQSGLDMTKDDPNDVAVIIASGMGGVSTIEEGVLTMFEKGPERVTPFLVPKMIPNMAAGMVSIDLGLKGPNLCITTACAAGTHALGDAYRMIQRGDCFAALAGGTEAVITPLAMAGFNNMRALSRNNDAGIAASRPFDANRDGFVMGEGAGVMVLEDYDHAMARGANVLAEFVGYGLSGDAYHMTAPAPCGEGGARAMAKAVKSAGIALEDIGYINAHGTSTPLNDELETAAVKACFGDHAYKLKISSNKSQMGHLIGAAGAAEGIATVLSIINGKLPGTRNYSTPDPKCDLDYIPNSVADVQVEYAMSNSLGFGGHNCSVIFKRWHGK